MTDHESDMMVLGASVDMRRDACRRMVAASDTPNGRPHTSKQLSEYDTASQLHKAGERIAAKYRNKA